MTRIFERNKVGHWIEATLHRVLYCLSVSTLHFGHKYIGTYVLIIGMIFEAIYCMFEIYLLHIDLASEKEIFVNSSVSLVYFPKSIGYISLFYFCYSSSLVSPTTFQRDSSSSRPLKSNSKSVVASVI